MANNIRLGIVKAYEPKFKTYTVFVYGHKLEPDVPALIVGPERSYKPETRVLVGCFSGVDWIILGEAPKISARTGELATEINEEAVDLAGDVNGELSRQADADNPRISYRPVDTTIMAEPAIKQGDTLIQNQAPLMRDRSYLRLFGMGDFVAKVAPTCVFYMNRIKREIRIQANSFIQRFTGGSQEWRLQRMGDNIGETTRITRVKRRADDLEPSVFVEGTIPTRETVGDTLAGTNVAGAGKRIKVGNLTAEVDQDTDTIRISQQTEYGTVSMQIGSFAAENGPHPTTEQQNPDGPVRDASGADASSGFHVRHSGAEIVLTPDKIDLKKDGQAFQMSSSGIVASVESFQVNAQSISLNGAIVDIKGDQLKLNA